MKLKDVMTENVEVVAPDTSLEQAARKMRDLDVTCYPYATVNGWSECSAIVI
jgi:CBS domain-containing protein